MQKRWVQMQKADSGASRDHLGSGRRRNDDLIVHPHVGGSDTGPSGVSIDGGADFIGGAAGITGGSALDGWGIGGDTCG
jgi:hypothetical protein